MYASISRGIMGSGSSLGLIVKEGEITNLSTHNFFFYPLRHSEPRSNSGKLPLSITTFTLLSDNLSRNRCIFPNHRHPKSLVRAVIDANA